METPTGPDGRLAAFGNQLINVHLWLREELASLREDVGSYLDGRSERPRELRAHCLAFCSALSRHHTGEDDGAFPVLAERFPELRPVLEELRRDHHVVTDILRRLEELLGGLEAGPDPAEAQRVRAELDGLAALLESHFVYEEKRLVSVLNSLSAPGRDGSGDFPPATAGAVFAPGPWLGRGTGL
ncbi:hemerythrin-like domain-containing protein [Streptosporangium album]|uniref:Hemerythrin-like domain-containing protein n=1 Tax=Streptosporangium album TaxID=47479 RepID=A0A7W7RQ74_9ACTN|nr:hemerythrin domain-containing protein [Streptosporangium album]MBB4936145.1 hemerythrin-like domain-containing protein [Streptosporangium album]